MDIYFDNNKHKYTDEFGNVYISATTLIGKYSPKFSDKEVDIAKACERIGRKPNHPKYKKYKGKTYRQILNGWAKTRDDACDLGNERHNYLDNSIRQSNRFNKIVGKPLFYNNDSNIIRLFTIEDIKNYPNVGNLDLDYFVKTGIKDKYPKIFAIIKSMVKAGWKVYSEIGVFDHDHLIAGTIDVLFIKVDQFVILDWKTNKAPIRFEAGYWDKNLDGSIKNYIIKDETLKYPLNNLQNSVGIKYTLQLSLYDWMVSAYKYKHVSNILCRIAHEVYDAIDEEVVDNPKLIGKNKIFTHPIDYLEHDIVRMVGDYHNKRVNNPILFNAHG